MEKHKWKCKQCGGDPCILIVKANFDSFFKQADIPLNDHEKYTKLGFCPLFKDMTSMWEIISERSKT